MQPQFQPRSSYRRKLHVLSIQFFQRPGVLTYSRLAMGVRQNRRTVNRLL